MPDKGIRALNGLQLFGLWLTMCAGQWLYGALEGQGFSTNQAFHQATALLTVWLFERW